jgi:hypothetical protein
MGQRLLDCHVAAFHQLEQRHALRLIQGHEVLWRKLQVVQAPGALNRRARFVLYAPHCAASEKEVRPGFPFHSAEVNHRKEMIIDIPESWNRRSSSFPSFRRVVPVFAAALVSAFASSSKILEEKAQHGDRDTEDEDSAQT